MVLILASRPATAQTVTVRPEAAPGPLDNPLKGWCPYPDAGPIRGPYSMVFLSRSWAQVEPERGRYAFDRWEADAWSTPAAKGKHVVLRIFVDYPSRPSGLPAWLRAVGVKETPYTDHGGGLSPDYNDPRMVEALERLIAAMGARYDADPRVGFIELGLLGFWGEWHTYPRTALYATPETERRVIAAYRRAFPRKILLARTANGDAGRSDWLGFHDDMFPEDTDNGQDWSFLAGIRTAGRLDNWQRAAIGGEMVPGAAKSWLGAGYGRTLEMAERAHFTWVGPYCPPLQRSATPEFVARGEALVRRMGYQFRLTEVRHAAKAARGGPLPVVLSGQNEGVAPFYYPWPVELALLDAAGGVVERHRLAADVRSWRPGALRVDEAIKPRAPAARYRLALGIIDPATDRPSIAFANALDHPGGWAVVSSVDIGADRGPE